uniref:NADH-ubiquinone oxidoreductase chain 4L n=1 Tax=Synalpheus microneptunus TaxID=1503767 RepID=A0A6H0DRC1_9EUCA|nr:NADH dehydrogenase subunit 4L [Synalpheus microneptunus]QIS92011.1 NADH dehydrogenase subunit 4L [Synalpheus microneptunus]
MAIISFVYLVPLVCMACGLVAFALSRKHLLNTLLSLEFIVVNLFWFMSVIVTNLGGDLYFVLYFLTLAACEGALGLGLLVCMVRSHGNDNFMGFNVL